MTIAAELASRALVPPSGESLSYLRALTLTNVAAALGDLGTAGQLMDRIPLDAARPADASFLRAMQLHARTQDDFHPLGRVHVGAVTLAAVVALADAVEPRFLESLAAGYETMCAVASVYSADAQRRGYRPTGFFGPIGAAASAGLALGLDRDGIANAISLAAASSKGTNQSWVSGTDEWLLEVGSAARAGVEAVQLTIAGAVGAPDAFEGTAGWTRAFFDDEKASRLEAALAGGPSRITEVAVKPFPVSGIAQVATALGCELHDCPEGRFPQRIVVRMSRSECAYPGSVNRGPFRSRSAALMSVVFCVACAVADGAVRLARLEDPNAPDLRRLMDRIDLEPDAAVDEGEATLEVQFPGDDLRLEGNSARLLHPSWEALAADAAALATRSEADVAAVLAVRDALAAESVDAREMFETVRSTA